MRLNLLLAGLILAIGSGRLAAEVLDSSASGFTVKATVPIQASRDAVYRALIHDIGQWWDPDHTFSGDSHNLSIEEKPMGCFCEKLPNEGGVRHMEVVRFAPGKTLVLIGALGPLQTMAATGSMTIQIAPAGNGATLEATYAVTGYAPGGLNALAATVDGVLKQQFTRLKSYLEHGDPAPKGIGGAGPRP
jgi:uncharacterized protein YndB with AHSA1/START domain